jgi:hypothetical protein
MTCVFECFQSHGHILKKIHEFFVYDGCHNHFWRKKKKKFIFNFVDYGLVTKSLGARCTFEEAVEKTKCQKMNVNF